MPTYETVRLERADGVATLTLNRPDRLNSFTVAMHGELRAALDEVAADTAVRCLVLTGAGRGFCAGQDLADRAVAPGSEALDLGFSIENYYKPMLLRLRHLRMPTVCAVNGVAAGAGANIPFACDLVIAARSASFIQSFSKLGLVPDCGGTWWLPRLVGPARAMGLALLGDKLPAAQAEAMGPDLALRRRRPADAKRARACPTARERTHTRLRAHARSDGSQPGALVRGRTGRRA